MKIRMIAACDERNGIGKDGRIPWHHPEDLKHFKKLTSGGNLVMGRVTFESIGFPLPNRKTFLVTSQTVVHDDVRCVPAPDALWWFGLDELWICGGERIYEAFYPQATEFYLTRVKGNYDCDRFLAFDEHDWDWETLSEHDGFTFLKGTKKPACAGQS